MPLMFDMPLERLLTYEGRNPRPQDFDDFWTKSVAEMEALGTDCQLYPTEFTHPAADCYELWFKGVKGASVHAKLAVPKNAGTNKSNPAIIKLHGYSGDAGDWMSKIAWVAAGFTIAAIDCRGQGGKSEDVGGVIGNTLHGHIIRGLESQFPKDLLFRDIYLDCAQLTRIVMARPEVDPDRVGCYGGSQGGGLTIATAALVPQIKRAAPIFPFLSDYKRVWEMDLAQHAYAELKEFFRHTDPLHQREDETFTKLGYIDVQFLAPKIKAEVMMTLGLMDTICPPSTQFAAYNKITSKKSYVAYPDFGHEDLPGKEDRIFQFMLGL